MSAPADARRPDWLRIRLRTTEEFASVRRMMDGLALTTVCEEARCPNIFECWSAGTATFMILGDVCTRRCGFCAVTSGLPSRPPDSDEPRRVADAVRDLRLAHAVITSVDRDDLPGGGAEHFARVVEAVHSASPACAVEVLTPDFKNVPGALVIVLGARPEVFSHNIETVPRIYRAARPGSRYEGSLALLSAAAAVRDRADADVAARDRAAAAAAVRDRADAASSPAIRSGGGAVAEPRQEIARAAGEVPAGSPPREHAVAPYRFRVKTGLMAGIGETDEELRATFRDIRSAGVEVLTIGQYLQPTKDHLPVDRFVHPETFAELKAYALSLGFLHVESGPLVRSSYRAHTHRPDPQPLHQS